MSYSNLRNLYSRYCIVYCFLPLNECFDRDYMGPWRLRRPCTIAYASDMCIDSEAASCSRGADRLLEELILFQRIC
jgi:hypothetical protein